MRASSSNAEAAKDCFIGTNAQITKEVKLVAEGLCRTQDIKIILPKFAIIAKGEINDETRPRGHENTTFLDKLNRMVIENDLHYSKFKYERQSNFKSNVVNTLGLFEQESVYKTVLAQLSTVG